MEHAASPLRVAVLAAAGATIVEAARLAVADIGQTMTLDPARADLRVALLDQEGDDEAFGPPTPNAASEMPTIAALHTSVGVDRAALWTAGPTAVIRFDGPSDLRWKLAQTLARYLSGALREALRRQSALFEGGSTVRLETILSIAEYRDPHAPRLLRRLLPRLARRRPDDATVLAGRLVEDGRPAGYALALSVLRVLLDHDSALAQRLLGDLVAQSPAFLAWLLEQADR